MTAGAPWFVLVAGVNGAGKSTFAQNPHSIKTLCGLTGAADEIEIINPDLITVEIMGINHSLSLDHANKRAADACEQRVRHLVEGGSRSFVIETVLSTDKYKPIVERAQEKGFRLLFVYVVLASVEEAVQRVAMSHSLDLATSTLDRIEEREGIRPPAVGTVDYEGVGFDDHHVRCDELPVLGVGVREELHGALMVGVFGHEHAEERAAVDENMPHRRVSWLSA
jgi:predicted ABC-type ATPase